MLTRTEPESDGRVNFQWDDPLFLEAVLSEEERMVRDTGIAAFDG